jgi:ubiquinone/menaquinone biosynthesis C-methylase UbiE
MTIETRACPDSPPSARMPDVLMHTRDIKRHYAVERALADRLRKAGRSERLTLYSELYNELFKSVPDHPQVTAHKTPEATASETARQFGILCPFLTKDSIVLEIGAGGCHLSQKVARHVRQVYALDVSDEIATRIILPANCKLVLSDGLTVPVPEGSVDVAYSNQLMEHLHPDDAVEQLHNVYRALKPGGAYMCITPNALCGPHDVSRGFDREPTGFHLKEYDNRQLTVLFQQAGFRRMRAWLSYKRVVVPWTFPMGPVRAIERVLSLAPHRVRQVLGYPLSAIKFIGYK